MTTQLIRIATCAAIALSAGPVLADGMPEYAPAPRVEAPLWSGFYFGVGLGYGHGSSQNNYSETDQIVGLDADVFSSSFDGEATHGGLATVILGADRQVHDKFVLGAFVDFDWSDMKLSYSEVSSAGVFPTIDDELNHEWSWAVGGRAGYLFTPATLVYFTGGFTQAHFKSDGWYDIYTFLGDVLPGKSSVTFNGYFVGFGMDTWLGHDFFLRGEMRYADFEGQVVNSGVYFGDPFSDDEEPSLLTGRLTLSYKFGHRDRAPEPIK